MLARVKSFVKMSMLGGAVVILPVVIVFLAFRWLVSVIARVIAPLTMATAWLAAMMRLLDPAT